MNENNYNDIINLPHHVSPTRTHMPIGDRAAQFAPFAALTGYDSAIKETARNTNEKFELDDNAKVILDEKLRYLQENTNGSPVVIFTYFVPDKKKQGGKYVSYSGRLNKVDNYEQKIILDDGTVFPVDNLYRIDSDVFDTQGWL